MKESTVKTRTEFEVFKGNVKVFIKEYGPLGFIEKILLSNDIEKYWQSDNKLYAIYLLAMTDYLCKETNLPLCTKYNYLRVYKFKERVYPLSIILEAKMDNGNIDDYISDAIPEFLEYNIVEGDIYNVC